MEANQTSACSAANAVTSWSGFVVVYLKAFGEAQALEAECSNVFYFLSVFC